MKRIMRKMEKRKINLKIKMLKWTRNNHRSKQKELIKRNTSSLKMTISIKLWLMQFGSIKKCQQKDKLWWKIRLTWVDKVEEAFLELNSQKKKKKLTLSQFEITFFLLKSYTQIPACNSKENGITRQSEIS